MISIRSLTNPQDPADCRISIYCCCGIKLCLKMPALNNFCIHWQSFTSVLRPLTCLVSLGLTRHTLNPQLSSRAVERYPIHTGGFHGHLCNIFLLEVFDALA